MEMIIMKRLFLVLIIFLLTISLIGCNSNPSQVDEEIHVGVSFYPMKDILELIKEDLAGEGYDLKIHDFSDYQTPNELLQNQELDANMIQHDYFLQAFNRANDSDLVTVQAIYHATFALYSKDYKDIGDLPKGSNITLPDDSTNLSRALYLLKQAGLLTFKDDKVIGLTIDDIESNPKDLRFEEQVPLTSLAQKYEETGLAIMYPTYAKSLELIGDEERLYVEKQDEVTKDYAISLVARRDNKDSDKIKTLVKHITSDKVRQFLVDEYSWASIPAF